MQDIDTVSAWEVCGMRQRGSFRARTMVGGILLFAFLSFPLSSFPRQKDYSSLVDLLRTQQKAETPLYAVTSFEGGLDEGGRSLELRFVNEHSELMRTIRKDLGSGQIHWRLEHSRRRLLFVPEKRETFARLFKDYCGHVIAYTLEETKLDNPYVRIVTLGEATPRLSEEGVTVFLVNNLAEEVLGTYVFSNPAQKSLRIDLSRKTFLGEVGSYTTSIRLRGKDEPEFTWDRFTIWQTTAKSPFSVLSVPVEETLHIALREHTHRAIQRQFEADTAKDAAELKDIVDEWMAVEEALVGGVVHALLPRFLKTRVKNLPQSSIREDLESRSRFKQYRHLGRAIRVVRDLGCEEAIRLYRARPEEFRQLII